MKEHQNQQTQSPSNPVRLMRNLVSGVGEPTLTLLHDKLAALENCHTGSDCWKAEHVGPLP